MIKEEYRVRVVNGTVMCGMLTTEPDDIMLFRGLNRYGNHPSGIESFVNKVMNSSLRDEIRTLAGTRASLTGQPFKKVYYKLLGDEFGVSVSKLMEVWDSTVYVNQVLPVKRLINRYAKYDGFNFNYMDVKSIIINKEKILQAEKDGNDNIVPYILLKGETPEQLKKSMGKGLWKDVCKRSLTQNKNIATGYLRGNLKELTTLPASIWKNKAFMRRFTQGCRTAYYKERIQILRARIDSGVKVKEFLDEKYQFKFINECNIFGDTRMMAEQLGKKKPNVKWSPERIKKMHDSYVKEINERMYSKDIILHLNDVAVQELSLESEDGIYSATLLKSAYAIYEEGQKMHHCVASYTSSVRDGMYLVYSIHKDGESFSTLGIRVSKNDIVPYQFSQHYKACNQTIVEKGAQNLARSILNELNKHQ